MPDDQPNVLFLFSDEHSYRYLGGVDYPGGNVPVETPALDGLFDSGTLFESAYCQYPLCTPSRICTLTGREQRRCGAWNNGSVVPPDCPTIPGTFSAAGYETALVGKGHFGGDRQYAGFDHRPYGDLTGQHGHQGEPIPSRTRGLSHRIPASRIRDAGVTTIPESLTQDMTVAHETASFVREREARSEPWLACASFTRPHFPYTAPQRFVDDHPVDELPPPVVTADDREYEHPSIDATEAWMEDHGFDDLTDEQLDYARAAYAACVEFLDEAIGDLLAMLDREGALENTIVVYTSDHGDLVGEHGLWFKRPWQEASTRVPFIVQTPEQRRGDAPANRISTPINLADLFPTLCGLSGVGAPDGLDGQDLSAAVRSGTEPDRGPVVSDVPLSLHGEERVAYRMVRDGRWKYVQFRDAPELLFDLEADPTETRNLAADPQGDAAAALDRLRDFVDSTYDFDALIEEHEHDEELREQYAIDLPEVCDVEGGMNAYHLPDGRVVRADDVLYESAVIAENPGEFASDWPGED